MFSLRHVPNSHLAHSLTMISVISDFSNCYIIMWSNCP